MKNRIVATFIIALFLVPQVTFAAWWNPITWKVFKENPETASQKIIVIPSVPQDISPANNKLVSTEENNIYPKKADKAIEIKKTKKIAPSVKKLLETKTDRRSPPKIKNQVLEVDRLKRESEDLENKSKVAELEKLKKQEQDEGARRLAEENLWEEQENTRLKVERLQSPPAPLCSSGLYCGDRCWTACPNNQAWQCNNGVGTCSCPTNTLSCNDQCWSACSSGQRFSCTTTGAVCVNDQIAQVDPPTASQLYRLKVMCSSSSDMQVICDKSDFMQNYYSGLSFRNAVDTLVTKYEDQKIRNFNSNTSGNSAYLPNFSPPVSNPSYVPSTTIKNYDTPASQIIGKGTSYTDSLGFTHFSGDNGSSGTSYTDSLGFTKYSDNKGETLNSYTDSLGFTRTNDSRGNSINSYTDSLGFTRYSGNNGFSGTSSTDSLGFTKYSDNFGGNLTCFTDSLGFSRCN